MTRIHFTVGAGVLALGLLAFVPLGESTPLPATATEAEAYARALVAAGQLTATPDAVRCVPSDEGAAASFACDVVDATGERFVLFVLKRAEVP